jgi:hypothetical protein
MTEPVFTDPFYIKKFMDIQRDNVVMYNLLAKMREHPTINELIKTELDIDLTDIVKQGPT